MNNISIIDADSIIYLAVHNKKDEIVKTSRAIMDCCDNYVKMILTQTHSEYFIGYLTDGSFRYKLAKIKPYKGNRADFVKPKYYNLAKSYLIDEYGFKTVKDQEADDLCIMTYNYYKLTKEYNPIIASPDKDLRQIEGIFYDYKKNETISIDRKTAEKNLWKQVLMGDSSDNVPGLTQVGPVKAEKILENSTCYRTTVLNEYIKVYGEYQGILNFTENYQLIKMLETPYQPNEVFKLEKQDQVLDGW